MNWVIMPFVENYDQTRVAVQDVLDQAIPDLWLLLIDNGSHDPIPVDLLRDPRVVGWRYTPALLSLSTVWNTALQMVWQAGGSHALVVNNDVRLPGLLYSQLLRAQQASGAWFVSACNVGERYEDAITEPAPDTTRPEFWESRGGPDFSCFLITKECHTYFQFDEQFRPAYFEDNDYHRRLQLAGLGDRIFSLPIPYLHYGSGTITHVERVRTNWNQKFEQARQYYLEKWGGPPHQETYQLPFGQVAPFPDALERTLTGQGRPGYYYAGGLPWVSSAT